MKTVFSIIFLLTLSFISVPAQTGSGDQPKKSQKALEKCEATTTDLPPIMGVTFELKLPDLKKLYKTLRSETFGRKKSPLLTGYEIYTVSGKEIWGGNFKKDLASLQISYSPLGISSISMELNPKAKYMPEAVFDKLADELGLAPSFWRFREFDVKPRYLQWSTVCKDFAASLIIQQGYRTRLSVWNMFDPDPARKNLPNDTGKAAD